MSGTYLELNFLKIKHFHSMKKIYFFLLLVTSLGSVAQAQDVEWQLIVKTASTSIFYDKTKLWGNLIGTEVKEVADPTARSGFHKVIYTSLLTDGSEPKIINGKKFQSVVSVVLLSCDESKIQFQGTSYYAGQKGKGEMVDYQVGNLSHWKSLTPTGVLIKNELVHFCK